MRASDHYFVVIPRRRVAFSRPWRILARDAIVSGHHLAVPMGSYFMTFSSHYAEYDMPSRAERDDIAELRRRKPRHDMGAASREYAISLRHVYEHYYFHFFLSPQRSDDDE